MSEDARELGPITSQIIITRRLTEADDMVSVEFSDGTSVVEALGMLEFAKVELFGGALGIEEDGRDYDAEPNLG